MTRNKEPKHLELVSNLATKAQDGTQKVLLELSWEFLILNKLMRRSIVPMNYLEFYFSKSAS